MYCKYCGKVIDNYSSYCKYCGKKLDYNSEVKTSQSSIVSSSKKIKNRKTIVKSALLSEWKVLFFVSLVFICFVIKNINTQTEYVYQATIFYIVGICMYILGEHFLEKMKIDLDIKRLRPLTGEENVGTTINYIGITYFETDIKVPINYYLNYKNDISYFMASVKYQFFSIFSLPIIPLGCHYVYVPLNSFSPNCKLYANCEMKWQEVISIYLKYWGILGLIVGLILIIYPSIDGYIF